MQGNAGWLIVRSMPVELDTAILTVGGGLPVDRISPELDELFQRVPAGWREEGELLLGPAHQIGNLLQYAARTASVLFEERYDRATLAIRELTAAEAVEREAARLATLDLAPDPALPLGERYVDLAVRGLRWTAAANGIHLGAEDALVRQARAELARVPLILRDGRLAARYWHWLDRFYYECYKPWREGRLAIVEALEQRAVAALGAPAGDVPPDLGWLAPQNPLLRSPELERAVRAGRLRVAFLAEPFGMFDAWGLDVGLALVSFADPGATFEHFRAYAATLAARLSALADPTRLAILRLIRGFSWSNTDIAAYLELSRPTVSIHAKVLREAGLISTSAAGREARHELAATELRRLFHDLERFLDLPPEDDLPDP